jgi:tetraacyldisaccharide-1-P 4'-kinase
LSFADHHPYSRRDVDRIVEAACGSSASVVVTTEKDLVRLLRFRPFALPFVAIPLALDLDDFDGFDAWLVAAVERARA